MTSSLLSRFLSGIFNGADGWIDLRALRGAQACQKICPVEDLTGIHNFVDLFDDWNVYFGVASRKDGTNGTRENLSSLHALFIDIDYAVTSETDAVKQLEAFPLRPSAEVQSGGGLHVYWGLREPMQFPAELEQASVWLRRLARTFQADLSAAEPARVLRLPGTVNLKYRPARDVLLKTDRFDHRYNASEFDDLLLSDPTPIETSTSTPFVLPAEPLEPGQRDKTLWTFGRSLRAKGMSRDEISIALQIANDRCRPPKTAAQVDAIVTKVMKAKDRPSFNGPVVDVPSDPVQSPLVHDAGHDQVLPAVPETASTELAALLKETAAALQRFVVMEAPQFDMVVLWVALTHTVDAFTIVPYLHVTAGTKRAGKSRLLELLRYLVRRPWLTARTTVAALSRKLAKEMPTLLLDEVDVVLSRKGVEKSEYAMTLIGILNAGFARGLTVTICVGEGARIAPQDLAVFGPKALAGIGALPSTIADRSIPIRLRRKLKSESTERARDRTVRHVLSPLCERFEAWAPAVVPALASARPSLPDELDDRAQDILEPLFALADLAGGRWPDRVRLAAVQLMGGRDRDDDAATQLLADIRDLVTAVEGKAVVMPVDLDLQLIVSSVLLPALEKLDDRPWATWSRGELMTAHALAHELKKFELEPCQRWSKALGKHVRGYAVAALEEACLRFLPPVIEAGGTGGANETGGKP